MKNFKINIKRISTLLLTGFIVINTCSCGKNIEVIEKNDYAVENSTGQTNVENVQNSFTVENLEKVQEDNKVKEVIPSRKEETKEIVYSDNDKVIVDKFNSIKNHVIEFLNSEKVEDAQDKAKGVFISTVDFLFYDAEINGIKFDDLTDEGKKKVLEIVSEVDLYIMNKFPTYKEDISETTKNAYIKASELIKKGIYNIKELSKEKLGEENYNSISSAKDELVYYTKEAAIVIGDISSKVWSNTKEKIKDWYEEFRNN